MTGLKQNDFKHLEDRLSRMRERLERLEASSVTPEFFPALTAVVMNFEELAGSDPVPVGLRPSPLPPTPGVYLFTESGKHLYVGRTRNLRARVSQHVPGTVRAMGPTLAVRLARKMTNRKPTYRERGGLKYLLAHDQAFQEAFKEAVARIRQMEVRFVEEANPLRSTLLELLVATELGTCYNSFETS